VCMHGRVTESSEFGKTPKKGDFGLKTEVVFFGAELILFHSGLNTEVVWIFF
jgi:hypothetical protein